MRKKAGALPLIFVILGLSASPIWAGGVVSAQPVLDIHMMDAEHGGGYTDALIAPDLPPAGMALAASASVSPGYYQTSEYMAGVVAVGIVLVESDGSVDPSTEDWTAGEKRQVLEEIAAAFDWWEELEPRAHLRFVYEDHVSDPLPTRVEPITRPYGDQKYWIADAMAALGYSAPSYFTRVRDYNNDLRVRYGADWAFTIFVVDSSSDRDNRFSDGYFAYAYLGGPFMVMTYGNNGYGPYNLDAVAAHEIGHVFYALDQYAGAQQPCSQRSGYLDVENQNSQYGMCLSDVDSIMRSGTGPYLARAIDPYAAGQIGWRDSDGDGILDPLDVALAIESRVPLVSEGSARIEGTVRILPYPSLSRPDATINRLVDVRYRFDGGEWRPALADDGVFDEAIEEYHADVLLPPGLHVLEVAAEDSFGNRAWVYAPTAMAVADPTDGGLNTELYGSSASLLASRAPFLSGIAYHTRGGIVADVQYRVDGGAWRPADPQDGAFDSGYEPFILPLDSLDAGTHLVEARAIDAAGNSEVNFASRLVGVVGAHTIFLPMVVR